ncbi:hypothetical protein [Calothrix sp. NIES-2098]|uniref:hypothetical protein n=1 Tax=Calothrix sp. NIES-2098 TaxID=1954171 RepID=UPI0030DA4FB3
MRTQTIGQISKTYTGKTLEVEEESSLHLAFNTLRSQTVGSSDVRDHHRRIE